MPIDHEPVTIILIMHLLKIGIRFLLSERRNGMLSFLSIFSLLGVTLGVAALLVVLSVMNGFTTSLQKNLIDAHSHIIIQHKEQIPFVFDPATVATIKTVPDVQGVSPFINLEMMVSTSVGALGTQLKAIDAQTIDQVTRFSKNLQPVSDFLSPQQPKLLDLVEANDPPGIILGSQLARRLRAIDKERIKIISPFSTMGPLGSVPLTKEFQLMGLLETGVFEIDSQYSYILLKEGQKLLDDAKTIHGYEIKVKDPYKARPIAQKIQEKLNPDLLARDWTELHANLFYAFRLEKAAMFSILCFVIIIASFSIIATLFMIVADKQRQISVLKALGATSQNIMKIFSIQGLLIGIGGTISGLIVGSLMCLAIAKSSILKLPDIYYQQNIPVEMKLFYFIIISVTALIISLLVTFLPARQAGKITPLEGIRYVKQ